MRNTGTLEEAELIAATNEPQSEDITPPPSEPEAAQSETTAVVIPPSDTEIIEGEVIVLDPPEEIADHTPPKQTPYYLLIPLSLMLCLSFLGFSYLLPLFSPSATVTIIPVEQSITTLASIQVHGRTLLPLTLSQSQTMQATGHRHQDAQRARGSITFYNGLFTSQTIAAGTVLTGSDGVQIVTDQPAIIPAANPPYIGQVTVSAHVIHAGQRGNIQAGDINEQCCLPAVKAVNNEAFQGGQNARDYSVVTRTDINTAVTSLLLTLSQSEDAALQAQLQPTEQLITPSCTPRVSSDHKIGAEAKHVSVSVSVTCSGIAFAAHEVYANATQLLTSQAGRTLGANYALVGDIQVTIVHATIINNSQGQAHMLVQIAGTWVYQITPPIQQHLVQLIAGKTKQQAITILLHFPGINAASMQLAGGNTALPADPNHIHILVMYRSN